MVESSSKRAIKCWCSIDSSLVVVEAETEEFSLSFRKQIAFHCRAQETLIWWRNEIVRQKFFINPIPSRTNTKRKCPSIYTHWQLFTRWDSMKIVWKFFYFAALASHSIVQMIAVEWKVQVSMKFRDVSSFTTIKTTFMLMPKNNFKSRRKSL